METIITGIVAFAAGLLVSALLARRRQAHAAAEAERRLGTMLRDKEESCRQRIEEKERACRDTLAAQERRHGEATAAQERHFDDMMAKVTAQMRSATADMLRQRQQEFAADSHSRIGEIVTPLRDTIAQMEKAMTESRTQQTAMSGEMRAAMASMLRQSEAARQSADALTHALKHDSKVQGDWGETVLDELLQSQGLTRGIHYDVQPVLRAADGQTVKTDSGGMLRPDLILHLDPCRDVVVDAKVSLTAFIDYANADNAADRQRCLLAHIESLQSHVRELAKKDYAAYLSSPKEPIGYVIMFVPHAGALQAALQAQPDLWRKAMEQNVFIADEQTLCAALKIISLTWRQIRQAENHKKLYDLANEMMDRVGQFMKQYQALGKAIDGARHAYDEGEKKLSPGGQSILTTCAKLTKLGAQPSSRNPLPQIADMEDGDVDAVTASDGEEPPSQDAAR